MVVSQHLVTTPTQDDILARLAGYSRCDSAPANEHLALVSESETEQPTRSSSGVIEACRPPDEIIGGKSIDFPVRAERESRWTKHAWIVDRWKARKDRGGRVVLKDQSHLVGDGSQRLSSAGCEQELVRICRDRKRLEICGPASSNRADALHYRG
jgi:hypothetical protein